MIRAGFVIENARTGSRTTVLESDAETGGRGWLLEVRCLPGRGPDIPEHLHLDWIERFEILSGSAYYRLGGVQQTAQAGDSIVMPPGQRQVHPWNAGTEELVYRQRDEFPTANPSAVQEVLGTFATLSALGRAGKLNKHGLPKNPLQAAATLRTLVRYGGYDASMSPRVQDFLAATLGRLAELCGYHAVNPRLIQG